jgi:hypothetical protein
MDQLSPTPTDQVAIATVSALDPKMPAVEGRLKSLDIHTQFCKAY